MVIASELYSIIDRTNRSQFTLEMDRIDPFTFLVSIKRLL